MIREFERKPPSGAEREESGEDPPNPDAVLETESGLQRLAWDLKYRRPELLKGAVMSISYTGGAFVMPGSYTASLSFRKEGGEEVRGDPVRFEVVKDPRTAATEDDLRQQHDLVRQSQALLERVHGRIGALREARDQLEAVEKRARQADRWTDELEEASEALRKGLTEVEDELIQTKNEAGQDPVNFTPRLDNQIAYLYGHVAQNYGRPTGGSFERFRDLDEQAKPILERLASLLGDGVADLNRVASGRRRHRRHPRRTALTAETAWTAGFSRHRASSLSRGGSERRPPAGPVLPVGAARERETSAGRAPPLPVPDAWAWRNELRGNRPGVRRPMPEALHRGLVQPRHGLRQVTRPSAPADPPAVPPGTGTAPACPRCGGRPRRRSR